MRPVKLFGPIEAPPSERIANVPIPARPGAGGLTLLETFLAIGATRNAAARRVFELGTFLGSTTLNLALNAPGDAGIPAPDLDEDHAREAKRDAADVPLTRTHLSSKPALDFSGSPICRKIETLTGNSTTFDFSAWKRPVDFVFIAGGHDLATVESDTGNALEMVAMGKPSCILWHDHGNPEYGSLTRCLNELSE